ncbi:hypothetical protein ACVWU7_000942 [Providencia stuartii]
MEKYWSDHKMLTHSNLDINLNDMYQYKLKSLFNSRVPPINDKIMAFTEWDNNMEKNLSLNIKNNTPLISSEWNDLFYSDKLNEVFLKKNNTNYYLFFNFLKVLPSIFIINKNIYYKNKNLYISYFINQLKIKFNFKMEENINESELKSELFNYLIYELGAGNRYDKLFRIKNNQLFFNLEGDNHIEVKSLINLTHSILMETVDDKNTKYIETIKIFYLATVDFLLNSNDGYHLPYNDIYIDYTNPNTFIDNYLKNKDDVFKVLVGCMNEGQSKCNIFISEIIYMNYIYYVLRGNPSKILDLEEYCNKTKISFLKIINRIINRRFYVNMKSFKGINLGMYLSRLSP